MTLTREAGLDFMGFLLREQSWSNVKLFCLWLETGIKSMPKKDNLKSCKRHFYWLCYF